MAKDFFDYQALADAAMRGVVREALRRVEKVGLVGAHHFYLTFKTKAPGVILPPSLSDQYPDEMTIILQHQFWGLKVSDDSFDVTLTFKKMPATLTIPFSALTAFFDPGVQFGLQFKGAETKEGTTVGVVPLNPTSAVDTNADAQRHLLKPDQSQSEQSSATKAGESHIVSLDSFRKK